MSSTPSPRLRIAVLGSRGRLGAALIRLWSAGYHRVAGFARPEIDLTQPKSLEAALRDHDFHYIVNCAAMTNVDACETDPAQAEAVNTDAPARLAEFTAGTPTRLIHISTDYVYDGRRTTPYTEDIPVSPISVYGNTKAAGERAVEQADPRSIIARVSWVFGPDRASFIDMILARARGDDRVSAIADKWSTPTYTDDLATWIERLIAVEAPGGLYHLTNSGACTWQEYGEFALTQAARAGATLKTTTVRPQQLADMETFVAERPVYTVLDTTKFTKTTGITPPTWQDAVGRYVRSIE